MRNIKVTVLVIIAIASVVLFFNYFNLYKPIVDVIESDTRNTGIDMRAYYGNYIIPSVLVLDIRNISGEKSPIDVFRIFLQYAKKVDENNFDVVKLASNGNIKFTIKGDYFKQLGVEYDEQNPVYTMRTFPEHVYKLDGERAFSSWTGGVLGVVGKQMEEFVEFHKQWYIEDMGEK